MGDAILTGTVLAALYLCGHGIVKATKKATHQIACIAKTGHKCKPPQVSKKSANL